MTSVRLSFYILEMNVVLLCYKQMMGNGDDLFWLDVVSCVI